jgi:hypothetical protein
MQYSHDIVWQQKEPYKTAACAIIRQRCHNVFGHLSLLENSENLYGKAGNE